METVVVNKSSENSSDLVEYEGSRHESLECLETISEFGTNSLSSESQLDDEAASVRSILVETDISKCGIIDENTPLNVMPVLKQSYGNRSKHASGYSHDSSTQTDITALPPVWKSESYLADGKSKMPLLPTMPSKFLNFKRGFLNKSSRFTRRKMENRRILLSDINFTSMVPELSRSVDHLSLKGDTLCKIPIGSCKPGSQSQLSNRTSSFQMYKMNEGMVSYQESVCLKNICLRRRSLPNITASVDSEESTESLIEDSEECIRKSIDDITRKDDCSQWGYRGIAFRTTSLPNLMPEFSPPNYSIPYVAKSPEELKVNHLAKVICKNGRVLGGRIQYVGTLPARTEPYVGISLPKSMGNFQGYTYFNEENNGCIFVPFRKVIMAWKV